MNILGNKLLEFKDYNIGFNICDNNFIVSIIYPEKWTVSNPLSNNVEFYKDNNNSSKYYYISQISNGIEVLFDEINNIIEYNTELENKTILFKEKINELKELFYENDLNVLKTLKFKYRKKRENKENKVNNELKDNDDDVA